MTTLPEKCEDVIWSEELTLEDRNWRLGDVIWNPKEGKGHTLVAQMKCSIVDCGCDCGFIGQDHIYATCECGKWDPIDHHNYLIQRHVEPGAYTGATTGDRD